MGSIVAKPLSRKNIRDLAHQIRKSIDLDNSLWFPVIQFLEFVMPEIDEKFCLEIKSKKEMGNCHGIARPDKHCIELREDVYERAIDGAGRDRFTIAHEIGHYFLHTSDSVALARTGQNENIPSYKDPEWQANAFAGELLVPSNLVKDMDIGDISRSCGVSYTAAKIQRSKS